MNLGTPKKISDLKRCFICSAALLNDKILIFGRSALNFAELIKSSIRVDVESEYANASELAICRDCYKSLIKFNKCLNSTEDIKNQLIATFSNREPFNVKRLSKDEELTRGKALRCLDFTASTSTQLISSVNSLSGSIPSTPRRPFQLAFPQSLPHENKSPVFTAPQATSTPIANTASPTTVVTVQYRSKPLKKTLCGGYQAIGKALAHGVPSQIASAALKHPAVRKQLLVKTFQLMSKEITSLCSIKTPSLLRKSGKEDLSNFNLQNICEEWKQKAPIFYSFLMTSAVNKRTKNYSWFPSVCVAGSVLLKQRSEKMDATACVIGVLLKSKSIEVC